MNLADFDTLQAARDYKRTTYRKIGGNEARQIFSMFGDLDRIESGFEDSTVVQVIDGIDTTVGQLCKAVYATIQNGQFATDPATQDGQLNRAAAAILRANQRISVAGEAAFFTAAILVEQPHESATKHDFDKAKGAINKTSVTPQSGWLKITITADCERHNPQIYAVIQGVERRVAGFGFIEKAGDYVAQVPSQYSTLLIDDAYGVVSQ